MRGIKAMALVLVAASLCTPLFAQTITVTAPNGGETWTVGQNVTVTWGSTGAPGNVDIELSVDSGANYTVPLSMNTADDGTETFAAPNNPGTLCRVRVRDTATATVLDESDADFTIVTPSITVTAPNGGENWTVGGNQNVTWTSVGTFGTVDIELSLNSGATYTVNLQLTTANDGTESITVPNNPTTTARVRVSDTATGTILDESNADFTIAAAPTITVTAPNGGESWTIGGNQNVTWNSTGTPGNVDIELSLNSGATYTVNLQLNTTDDGTESITVPNNPTTTARVRVSDTATGTILDESNADFTITAAPTITVTAPNGGETWVIGSNDNVTWNSTGSPGNVDIELSLNSGATYTVNLQLNTADDGTETITVPNNPTTTARVRVSDTATGAILDESDADFTIAAPSITVTAPNGGESWTVAGNQNVTWTSVGVTGTVEIDLSTDGGGTFPISLANATANDGTQSITVPNNPGTLCRVRVSDTATGLILDASNANFTITTAPTITVTAPNGGENLTVGNNFNVTWTSGGSPGNVEIHLSTDGGGTFPIVLSATTADDGTQQFVVPNNPSTLCRVRVRDVATQLVSDTSNANFTIAIAAPSAVAMSAFGNPGDKSVSPGSTNSALGFRLAETGGGSNFTVTSVSVDINLSGAAAGVAAASITSVSLRRGGSVLQTITNGGAGWSLAGSLVTVNFTGLSAVINAGSNGDFIVAISFSGAGVPSPNPRYIASIAPADVNGGASVTGSAFNGGTLTLVDELPDDPLDEDTSDDSCELAAKGGPAWPMLGLGLLMAIAAVGRRVNRKRV